MFFNISYIHYLWILFKTIFKFKYILIIFSISSKLFHVFFLDKLTLRFSQNPHLPQSIPNFYQIKSFKEKKTKPTSTITTHCLKSRILRFPKELSRSVLPIIPFQMTLSPTTKTTDILISRIIGHCVSNKIVSLVNTTCWFNPSIGQAFN